MDIALDNALVLDLTQTFWGSMAGAMLADFGAEVVRIDDKPRTSADLATMPASWNYERDLVDRNKKSIALDLGSERGRELVRAMAAKAAVVLTDRSEAALRELGLDYDAVARCNPSAIYACGSGYGPKGPDKDLPAIDELAAARTGMMPILPQPGQPPVYGGHGQMYTSVMLAFGVAVALFHRGRTGEGQRIDASLLAGNMYGASLDLQAYLAIGGERMLAPVSRLDAGNPMSGVLYPSSDGRWITLTMPDTDRWWPALCEVTGIDPADPRFDSHDKRCGEHRLALLETLDQVFRARPSEHWRSEFTERQMSADVIESYDYPTADPSARHNRYILDLDDPSFGPISALGFPIFMSDTPARLRSNAPRTGQHTAEVLRDVLGYGENEIVALQQQGAIA